MDGNEITDYIDMHPLTRVCKEQSWNNIAIPVREMFELICDALIGQDIHTWERKSLINERFFKMQHLASRLNDRILNLKEEMTRWTEDVTKRTFEQSQRVKQDTSNHLEEVVERSKKENERFTNQLRAIENNIKKTKLDVKDISQTLRTDMNKLKKNS